MSLGGTPRNTDRVLKSGLFAASPCQETALSTYLLERRKPKAEPNLLPAIFSPVIIRGLLAQGKRPKNAGG